MISNHHGCDLVDLKNAEGWNNFFFAVRGQRWIEKTLTFCFSLAGVSEVLETRLPKLVHIVQKQQKTMSFSVSLII